MSVSLKKGNRVELTKGTGLKEALVGLGWETNRYQGSKPFDLDLVMFVCDGNRRCIDDKHFVFYHNPSDPEGAIKYSGDNRTGEGEGDDETATVIFDKITEKAEVIVIAATIYDAKANEQNFGQVDNSYIRIVDTVTGEELCRYDLCEKFSEQTSVVFGEIYKADGEWKFKAVGAGYEKELAELCAEYGVETK